MELRSWTVLVIREKDIYLLSFVLVTNVLLRKSDNKDGHNHNIINSQKLDAKLKYTPYLKL